VKINLLDIDSKIPNLALMKISAYHKSIHNEVFLNFPICNPDMTFASCIFTKNKNKVPFGVKAGGPGYNLKTKLPEHIERCSPDYSLYPKIDYSLGYTYRYCPRKCAFCNVWKMGNKRGEHHSIYEFYDKQFRIIRLLNNNTFADPDWRETFKEIKKENLIAHFDQGFDIRLLSEEKAHYLKLIKHHKQIYFAFDDIKLEKDIRQGIKILDKAKISRSKIAFFILTGFNSNLNEDIERVEMLRSMNIDCYVMAYNGGVNRLTREYARYVNTKVVFKTRSFEQFLKSRNVGYLLMAGGSTFTKGQAPGEG